jgi:hypothetical protein
LKSYKYELRHDKYQLSANQKLKEPFVFHGDKFRVCNFTAINFSINTCV